MKLMKNRLAFGLEGENGQFRLFACVCLMTTMMSFDDSQNVVLSSNPAIFLFNEMPLAVTDKWIINER